MGRKDVALTRTNVKVIINMNESVKALNGTQIKNLHDILDTLRQYDEKRKSL